MKMKNNKIAWLALLIAIVALTFSLTNNTGISSNRVLPSPNPQVQVQSIEQQAVIKATRAQLESLREVLASGSDRINEKNLEEIALARKNLSQAYENAGEIAKKSWEQLDSQLNELEVNMRRGGVGAIDLIDQVLVTIKTKIQYD